MCGGGMALCKSQLLNMQNLVHRSTTTQLIWPHKKHIPNTVRAEVVLGSPSANCRGVGICRVTAVYGGWKEVGTHCRRAKAIIGLTPQGKLYFSIFRKSVCKGAAQKHFGREEGFRVETAYELPRGITNTLRLERYCIEPGLYPVLETDSKWIVIFG